MAGKTAIYDDDMADLYDMSIDMDDYNKTSCYIFKQKVKTGKESDVVVDEMITWFNDKTFEVVARRYSLSYNAAVYDFKVKMEVEMIHICGTFILGSSNCNTPLKIISKIFCWKLCIQVIDFTIKNLL